MATASRSIRRSTNNSAWRASGAWRADISAAEWRRVVHRP
jgi:hypothetical protein